MTRLTRLTRALALVLGLGFAVLAGLAVGVLPAVAHDVLTAAEPADGSIVEVAPDTVQLTFSDEVVALGTEVQVIGPAGEPMSDGPAAVVGQVVRQALVPDRPAGSYTVVWRATSADGHPTSGQLTFTASAALVPSEASPPVVATPTEAPSATPPVDEPTDDPTAAPSDPPSDPPPASQQPAGISPWALVAGAGAIVALTAAAVWWIRRQR